MFATKDPMVDARHRKFGFFQDIFNLLKNEMDKSS